jgi:ABC-type sugar transport system substrate-binding protein
VTGFYATFSIPATGAIAAGRAQSKLKEWTIISTDTEATSMDQLKSGDLDAIMGQTPTTVGTKAIDDAHAVALGKPVSAKVTAPISVITQANADTADVYKTKQGDC